MAGRSLGPLLIFATVLAANIGAGSTVGVAGLGYRDGLSAWWWVGSAGIGSLVLALWVGPRIWRLARDHDLYTVGDFLEWRYNRTVRATIAGLLWFVTLAIIAGQLIGIAFILNVVAGVPKPLGCVIGGLVVTTYFTAGGLVTSAWVNLVQLVVMVLGFAIALPWILGDAGGWAGLTASAPATSEYFGFWRGGGSGWIYLAMLGPAFIVSPGLIQKVYGARDERAIRLGLGASALALMVFAVVPALLGMLAHAYDPTLENAELALPTVLMHGLPPALGALTLAAIFSAELSSADAGLFMLSTSISKDLYRRFLRPAASDEAVLQVARRTAVVGGLAATGLAILLPSVIVALSVFYSLLTVTLFVPVIAALYSRRAGSFEALATIVAGATGLTAAVIAGDGILPDFLTPSATGVIVSLVVFGVVLLLRTKKTAPPVAP